MIASTKYASLYVVYGLRRCITACMLLFSWSQVCNYYIWLTALFVVWYNIVHVYICFGIGTQMHVCPVPDCLFMFLMWFSEFNKCQITFGFLKISEKVLKFFPYEKDLILDVHFMIWKHLLNVGSCTWSSMFWNLSMLTYTKHKKFFCDCFTYSLWTCLTLGIYESLFLSTLNTMNIGLD